MLISSFYYLRNFTFLGGLIILNCKIFWSSLVLVNSKSQGYKYEILLLKNR